jgi:hypothetical protein
VLGTRWVYDGTRDPVLVAQLLSLCQGEAVPQHQSRSDTADPSVHVTNPDSWGLSIARFTSSDGDRATQVTALAHGDDSQQPVPVVFEIPRVLTAAESDVAGCGVAVLASWAGPGGVVSRGVVLRAQLDRPR